MKTKLTLSERFAILGILPAEDNFATLKVMRKLREQLSLTEAEIKEYGVIQVFAEQVVAIKSTKTNAEALAIASKMFGKDNAQRMVTIILNGTVEGNQITWENEGKTTEMEFGEFAENMIKETLEKMDKVKKLRDDKHFTLYEKFVEGA